MSSIVAVSRNWLTQNPAVLGVRCSINTTSPSEDPDFPLRNILDFRREKFWKCASTSPGTFNVDLDLGTSTGFRVAGILRNRQHGAGSTGITSVTISTGTGTSYPPTWTSRGTISLSPTDNDKQLDFGSSITCRQMRFAITDGGQYSCRLFVGRNADYLALGTEGAEVTEAIQRNRAPERDSYLGATTYTELGTGFAAQRRRYRFSHALVTTTAKQTWLDSQTGSLTMQCADGTWRELIHIGPSFPNQRAPGGTALDTHQLYLESLP